MFIIRCSLIEDKQMFDDSCSLDKREDTQVFALICPVIEDKRCLMIAVHFIMIKKTRKCLDRGQEDICSELFL